MDNFIQNNNGVQTVTQLSGLGSQMGVDIIIKAPSTQIIRVLAGGGTIQLEWTDITGDKIFAKAIIAGDINDTQGLNLGTYYPSNNTVFENQAAVDAFFTSNILVKIYNAILV